MRSAILGRHIDGLVVDGQELERDGAPVVAVTPQIQVDETGDGPEGGHQRAEERDDDPGVDRHSSTGQRQADAKGALLPYTARVLVLSICNARFVRVPSPPAHSWKRMEG